MKLLTCVCAIFTVFSFNSFACTDFSGTYQPDYSQQYFQKITQTNCEKIQTQFFKIDEFGVLKPNGEWTKISDGDRHESSAESFYPYRATHNADTLEFIDYEISRSVCNDHVIWQLDSDKNLIEKRRFECPDQEPSMWFSTKFIKR